VWDKAPLGQINVNASAGYSGVSRIRYLNLANLTALSNLSFIFPENWLANASVTPLAGVDGTFTLTNSSVSAQGATKVTFQRSGGTLVPPGPLVEFQFNATTNPTGINNLFVEDFGPLVSWTTGDVIVHTVQTVPAAAYATTTNWSGTPLLTGFTATAGMTYTFGANKTSDRFSNVRSVASDVPLVATLSGGRSASVVYHANGSIDATFMLTVAGNYTLTAVLGGVSIPGSPFSFSVQPAVVKVAESSLFVLQNEEYRIAGEARRVMVTLRDQYRNVLNPSSDAVSCTVFSNSVQTQAFNISNSVSTNINLTVAGENMIHLSVGGLPVPGSPFSTTVYPSFASAAQSTLSKPAGAQLNIGTFMKLTVKDAYGNLRTAGDDGVVFSVVGPTGPRDVVVTFSQGLYTARFVPVATGAQTVTVTVLGAHVAGSPFTVSVSSDGGTTAAVGSKGVTTLLTSPNILAGQPTTVTVTLHDTLGVPVSDTSDVTLHLTIDGSVNSAILPMGVTADASTYTMTEKWTRAGTYRLQAFCCGGGSGADRLPSVIVVTVKPGAVDVQTSSVVSMASVLRAGEAAATVVQMADRYHNPLLATVAGEAVPALIKYTHVVCGGGPSVFFENGGGLGRWTSSINVTASGQYTVWATTRSLVHLQGSPFNLTVTPGAPAAFSSRVSGGAVTLSLLTAGAPASFSVLARDQFYNDLPGTEALAALLVFIRLPAGGGDGGSVDLVSRAEGPVATHWVSIKSARAWVIDVRAAVGGAHLPGSPFQVSVGPTETGAAQTTINGLYFPVFRAGEPVTNLTVVPRDTLNNIANTDNTDFNVQISSPTAPVATPPMVWVAEKNLFSVVYTPPSKGTYTVECWLRGTSISGSPVTISVLAGATSMARSLFEGIGLSAATAGATGTFSIRSRDKYDGDKPDSVAVAAGQESLDTFVGALVHSTNTIAALCEHASVRLVSGNLYHCNYVATLAGTYALSLSLPGTTTEKRSFSVTVVPTKPDSVASSASGSALTSATAGVLATFALHTRDAYGNPQGFVVSSGAPPYVVEAVVGGAVASGQVLFDAAGNPSASYRVERSGTYALRVKLNGFDIAGSPFPLVVHAGTVDAHKCSLVGGGTVTLATAGITRILTLEARDAYSNAVSGYPGDFSVSLQRIDLVRTAVAGNSSFLLGNQHNISFHATAAGRYALTISFASKTVANTVPVVSVMAADVSAPQTVLQGGGSYAAGVANVANTLVIVTYDHLGNFKDTSDNNLTGSISGPNISSSQSALTFSVVHPGVFSAAYLGANAGVNNSFITVQIGGVHIHGSPFNASFYAAEGAVSAANSGILGPWPEFLEVGTSFPLTIQARDSFNVPLRSGGASVVVLFNSQVMSVTDRSNGRYTAPAMLTVAGSYLLDIKIGGVAVMDSPKTVTLLPAATDTLNTQIFSSSNSFYMFAGSSSQLLISSRDRFGNLQLYSPVTNHLDNDKYSVAIRGPYSIDPRVVPPLQTVTFTYDSSRPGIIVASYTLTLVGRYSISVSLHGVEVSFPAFLSGITVAPGESYVYNFVVVPSPLGFVAGTSAKVEVFSRDRYNNKNANLSSTALWVIEARNVVDNNLVRGTLVPNADNTLSGSFFTTVAGLYSVSIGQRSATILHFSGSPFNMTVAAAPADSAKMSAIGVGLSLATGGKPDSFQVQTRDQYGNLASGGTQCFTVTFELQPPRFGWTTQIGATWAYETTLVGHPSGIYDVSYLLTRQGRYSASIVRNKQHLRGSPFSLVLFPGPTSPLFTTVDGAALSGLTAGVLGTLIITARDSFNNPKTVSTDAFTIYTPAGLSATLRPQGAFAQYIVGLTVTRAGNHPITIVHNGLHIQGSPFMIAVSPSSLNPGSTLVSGTAITGGAAGAVLTASMSVTDQFLNQQSVPSLAQLTLSLVGQSSTLIVPCTPTNQTLLGCSVVVTISGAYTVSAMVNGASALGPSTMTVTPAALDHLMTKASGPGLSVATAGVSASFEITARDRYGNSLTAGGLGFEAAVTTEGRATALSALTDYGNGTYSLSYTATISGQYLALLSLLGAPVGASPYCGITVHPGVPTAAKSTAHGTGTGGGQMGMRMFVTVVGRDVYGNLAKLGTQQWFNTNVSSLDHRVLVTVYPTVLSATGETTSYQAEHDVFQTKVNATVRVNITERANGASVAVFNVPTRFYAQAGPPSAPQFLVEPTTLQAYAGEHAQFEIRERDADTVARYNTTSKSTSFAYAANGPSLPILLFTTLVAKHLGNITSTKAGVYTVQMSMAGLSLGSSPLRLTVLPGPVAHAALTGPCVATAGTHAVLPLATTDVYGNPAVLKNTVCGQWALSVDTGATAQMLFKAEAQPSLYFLASLVGHYWVNVTLNSLPAKPASCRVAVSHGKSVASTSTFTMARVDLAPSSPTNNTATLPTNLSTPMLDLVPFGPVNTTQLLWLAAGMALEFTATARDASSNVVTDTCDRYTVEAVSAGLGTVTSYSTALGQGLYTVPLLLTRSGTYTVHVLDASSRLPLASSPLIAKVAVGAVRASSCVVSGPLHSVLSEAALPLCIRCVDLFGNAVDMRSQITAFNVSVGTVSFPVVAGNGTTVCSTLRWKPIETIKINIALNSSHVSGSPFSVPIVSTLDPPTIRSAAFSSGYSRIRVTFSVATNRGERTGVIQAAEMLDAASVALLGLNPTCRWFNSWIMDIYLGYQPQIRVGARLTLSAASNIRLDRVPSRAMVASFIVAAHPTPAPPFVAITGPSLIASCDNLVLQGDQSRGGAGWPLTFHWSVLPGPPNLVALQTKIEQSTASNASLVVPSSFLIKDSTYVFMLTVSNVHGAQASARKTVTVSGDPAPQVYIDGPESRRITKQQSTILFAVIKPASCYTGPAVSTLSTCTWSALTPTTFQLDPVSSRTTRLTIPGSSLTAGTTYTVQLRCNVTGFLFPFLHTTNLTVGYAPFTIAIGGPSYIGNATSLVLFAVNPVDPDGFPESDLIFRWSCTPITESGSRKAAVCFDDIHGYLYRNDPVLRIPAGTLPPGLYSFDLLMRKEPHSVQRVASATTTVRVGVDDGPVVALACHGTCTPDNGQPVVLSAVTQGDKSDSVISSVSGDFLSSLDVSAWRWQVDERPTNSSTSSFLTMPVNTFLPGTQSNVTLLASLATGTAVSSLTVTHPFAPSAGTCSVSPTKGTALVDQFVMTCANWQDDDPSYPLYYSLAVQSGGNSIAVGMPTLSPTRSVTLAAGPASNGRKVTLLLCVASAVAGQACTTTEVVVESGAGGDAQQEFVLSALDAAVASGDNDAILQLLSAFSSELESVGNGNTTSSVAVPISSQSAAAVTARVRDPKTEAALRRLLAVLDHLSASSLVVNAAMAQQTFTACAAVSRAYPTFNATYQAHTLTLATDIFTRWDGAVTHTHSDRLASLVSTQLALASLAAGVPVRARRLLATARPNATVLAKSKALLALTTARQQAALVPGQKLQTNGVISTYASKQMILRGADSNLPTATATFTSGATLLVPGSQAFPPSVSAETSVAAVLYHISGNPFAASQPDSFSGREMSGTVVLQVTLHKPDAASAELRLLAPIVFKVPSTSVEATSSSRALLAVADEHNVAHCMSWDDASTTWHRKGCLVATETSGSVECHCYHAGTHMVQAANAPPGLVAAAPGGPVVFRSVEPAYNDGVLAVIIVLLVVTAVLIGFAALLDEHSLREWLSEDPNGNKPLPKQGATGPQHILVQIWKADIFAPVSRVSLVVCVFAYLVASLFFNALFLGIAAQYQHLDGLRSVSRGFVLNPWMALSSLVSAAISLPVPMVLSALFGDSRRYVLAAKARLRALKRLRSTDLLLPAEEFSQQLAEQKFFDPKDPLPPIGGKAGPKDEVLSKPPASHLPALGGGARAEPTLEYNSEATALDASAGVGSEVTSEAGVTSDGGPASQMQSPANRFKVAGRKVQMANSVVHVFEKEVSLAVLAKTAKMVAATNNVVNAATEVDPDEDEDTVSHPLPPQQPWGVLIVYALAAFLVVDLLYCTLFVAKQFTWWMLAVWGLCWGISFFVYLIVMEPIRMVLEMGWEWLKPYLPSLPSSSVMAVNTDVGRALPAGGAALEGGGFGLNEDIVLADDAAAQLEDMLTALQAPDAPRDVTAVGGLPALLRLLNDTSSQLRWRAAAVIRAFVDRSPPEQSAAIHAGCLPVLVRIAKSDSDPLSRAKALQALTSLTRQHDAGLSELIRSEGLEIVLDSIKGTEAKVKLAAFNLLVSVLQTRPSLQQQAGRMGLVRACGNLVDSNVVALREGALRSLIALCSGCPDNADLCRSPQLAILEALASRDKAHAGQDDEARAASEAERLLIRDLRAAIAASATGTARAVVAPAVPPPAIPAVLPALASPPTGSPAPAPAELPKVSSYVPSFL